MSQDGKRRLYNSKVNINQDNVKNLSTNIDNITNVNDSREYWQSYYEDHFEPRNETEFASFILDFIENDNKMIELGCGNGRDSIFFSENNINVLGIDQAENEINYLNNKYSNERLEFLADDFSNLNLDDQFEYVYSRFTLHSISENSEDKVIEWAFSNLKDNGLFFIEARSTQDPMYLKGSQLSENENFTNHYRRYLDFEKTKEKLKNLGFSIVYEIEDKGLAVYKDDDPVVIRIIAKK